jgi:WhiB family redox-sensing transcriptional regulator
MTWHQFAACRGMDTKLFFQNHYTIPEAKEACERCPVIEQCREDALLYIADGYAGGMTASQRIAERRRRGIKLLSWESRNLDMPKHDCGTNAGYALLARLRRTDPTIRQCYRCNTAHAEYSATMLISRPRQRKSRNLRDTSDLC